MPGNPLTDPNWASSTTDTVVKVVDTVRQQTTQRVVYAARAVVFGIIAAVLGVIACVIILIGLVRGLHALLDLAVGGPEAVYLTYFILGGIFCLVGLLLFRKRNSQAT
jgi:hypothetical protein